VFKKPTNKNSFASTINYNSSQWKKSFNEVKAPSLNEDTSDNHQRIAVYKTALKPEFSKDYQISKTPRLFTTQNSPQSSLKNSKISQHNSLNQSCQKGDTSAENIKFTPDYEKPKIHSSKCLQKESLPTSFGDLKECDKLVHKLNHIRGFSKTPKCCVCQTPQKNREPSMFNTFSKASVKSKN
jgi:hypothetical protein